MVTYLKILSEMISMESFLLCMIVFSWFLTISNLGMLKAKAQKSLNWMVVIRCLAAAMLFFIILYILLLLLAGRFGDLITAIGNHPSVVFFFVISYITGRIYQRKGSQKEVEGSI